MNTKLFVWLTCHGHVARVHVEVARDGGLDLVEELAELGASGASSIADRSLTGAMNLQYGEV